MVADLTGEYAKYRPSIEVPFREKQRPASVKQPSHRRLVAEWGGTAQGRTLWARSVVATRFAHRLDTLVIFKLASLQSDSAMIAIFSHREKPQETNGAPSMSSIGSHGGAPCYPVETMSVE